MKRKKTKQKKENEAPVEVLDLLEESNQEPIQRFPALRGAGGRPRSYVDGAALQESAEAYVAYCQEFKQIPNKAGLCVHLAISRETLNQYRRNPEYSDAVRWIDGIIEDAWVQNLARPHAAGTIFYLKNAFAYTDKTETDLTSGGKAITYTIPAEIAAKHQIVHVQTEQIAAPAPKVEDKDTAM